MLSIFPSILATPEKGWEHASTVTSKKAALLRYALPLITIASACAFAGSFLVSENVHWVTGVWRFMVMFISLFTGVYFADFCIRVSYRQIFKVRPDFSRTLIFTIFSFSGVIAVIILDELVEDMFFISAFYLYTFYIVYEVCNKFWQMENVQSDKKNIFVLIASLSVIAWPELIRRLLFVAMPGLK